MYNILKDTIETPSDIVKRAANDLDVEARRVGLLNNNGRYNLTHIEYSIISYINGHLGANLGPAQNARAQLYNYFGTAANLGYDLNNQQVQKCFAQFLLAVATGGFKETDTTATQMGQHQGGWRGGGFN